MGREIAFTELTRCLPDQYVDVLWTKFPCGIWRLSPIPPRCAPSSSAWWQRGTGWPRAASIDVEQYCEEPMLYGPDIPEEWMALLWLAGLRSKHEARLVEIAAQDHASVLRKVTGGDAVITNVATMRPLPDAAARGHAARLSADGFLCRAA